MGSAHQLTNLRRRRAPKQNLDEATLLEAYRPERS
jgi:hypothetical protein